MLDPVGHLKKCSERVKKAKEFAKSEKLSKSLIMIVLVSLGITLGLIAVLRVTHNNRRCSFEYSKMALHAGYGSGAAEEFVSKINGVKRSVVGGGLIDSSELPSPLRPWVLCVGSK